jgi:hypothetical protein
LGSLWAVLLLALLSLVGAIVALVCGRARSYRRALGCSPRAATGASLTGLALGTAAGVVAGVVLARGLGAAPWVAALGGWAVAVATDAASTVWWSRVRGVEQPGFPALVAAVVGWWLLAGGAVALSLALGALLVAWVTVAIGYA